MIRKTSLKVSAASIIATLALVATVSVNAQMLDTTASTTSTTDASAAMTSPAVVTTPGLPNTGAGGQATTNLALLIGSGLIALGGVTFLARRIVVAK